MTTIGQRLLLLLIALCGCSDQQHDESTATSGEVSQSTSEMDADAPPRVRRVLAALRRSLAQRRCALLYFKALMLKSTTGEFPATLDDLVNAENPEALPLTDSEVAGGEPKRRDHWGKPLVYEVVTKAHYAALPTKDVRVTSAGPDGVMGTKDDITVPSASGARGVYRSLCK